MSSREELNRYSDAAARAVELAQGELQTFWNRLDFTNPVVVRDALLEFVPALVEKYGDVVASAAADWYEKLRADAVGGSYTAVTGGTVSPDAVQGSVRYAAGNLFSDPQQALSVLNGAIQKYVQYSGRETVARNVAHDPSRPRFARVPQGKTCAFCTMLASRGWVYHSKKAAGELKHYHDDCDCQIVPSWDKSPFIGGYDPDAMYDEYLSARESAGSGSPKAIAAEMRRKFPESYTDSAGKKQVTTQASKTGQSVLAKEVHKKIGSATNSAQLSDAMRRVLPNTDMRNFISIGKDLDSAKKSLSTLLPLLEKHPLGDSLTELKFTRNTNTHAAAWVTPNNANRTSAMTLNMTRVISQEEMDKTIARGWFHAKPGTSPETYFITHEYGHSLDVLTGHKENWISVRKAIEDNLVEQLGTSSESIASLGDKALLNRAHKLGLISEYSIRKNHEYEIIAESFATVETSPDMATDLERTIHGILTQKLGK